MEAMNEVRRHGRLNDISVICYFLCLVPPGLILTYLHLTQVLIRLGWDSWDSWISLFIRPSPSGRLDQLPHMIVAVF